MNFADQRRAAAKQAASILSKDKMPKDGMFDNDADDHMATSYMGEAKGSRQVDIVDSGNTIVNQPNGAYSKDGGTPGIQAVVLIKKKFRG